MLQILEGDTGGCDELARVCSCLSRGVGLQRLTVGLWLNMYFLSVPHWLPPLAMPGRFPILRETHNWYPAARLTNARNYGIV